MDNITLYAYEIAEEALGTKIKQLRALIARKDTKQRRDDLVKLKGKQKAIASELRHHFGITKDSLYN